MSARAHLFFAHQSVGENILKGLLEQSVQVTIASLTDSGAAISADVYHTRVGTNGDPESKCLAFESWLRSGMATCVQAAMLKFCYVDVSTDADADRLLSIYRDSLIRIRAAHPRLSLAHCTIPLRAVPEGAYATLRRALGHPHSEYARNAARERFNQALRRSMASEPIFDLARIEAGSEVADGRGRKPPALLRKYTSDGGHLNELGRRIVAMRFVEFVAGLKTR